MKVSKPTEYQITERLDIENGTKKSEPQSKTIGLWPLFSGTFVRSPESSRYSSFVLRS